MAIAQATVEVMCGEGVHTAFSTPEAVINPIHKYAENAPIEHLTIRHEEACVYATDGYRRAKNEAALAICSAGPGATNFVTGPYTAFIDSMLVLYVVGQANVNQLKREPFQCVSMPDIAKIVTKKTWNVLKAEDIVDVMKGAFYLMREGHPGPVLVELPPDVQKIELDSGIDSYVPTEIPVVALDMDKTREAVQAVKASKTSVITMGGGCFISHCTDKVVKLAEMLQALAVTTYQAKGGIPEDHPPDAGHIGIRVEQPIGSKIFLDSDLVIDIGNHFLDRHIGGLATYYKNRKFVRINIEPSQIGVVFEPGLGIVSDAKLTTEVLTTEIKAAGVQPINPARMTEISKLREELARKTGYDCSPVTPHRVFQGVSEAFDDGTYYTVGYGITQIWSGQLRKINKAGKYLPFDDAGILGYEVPAAFGVKVVHLECNSVAVVGNFGLTFMDEEIAAASAFKKPVIVVAVDDAYLELIRQNQKGYEFEYAVEMSYNQDRIVDYMRLGETYGCVTKRVLSPEGLTAALVRAKASIEASGHYYLIDAICVETQLYDMGDSTTAVKSWAPEV